jgi:hypothetical protein
LYDLERELVRAHSLRASFDELRLGPLLKQPLVLEKFLPDSSLTTVPVLIMSDVAAALNEYRFQGKFKNQVKLVDFLNWLAARRGVSSPRSLCLVMNKYAIGTIIKLFATASSSERQQRDAYIEQVLYTPRRPDTSL